VAELRVRERHKHVRIVKIHLLVGHRKNAAEAVFVEIYEAGTGGVATRAHAAKLVEEE
jgi:hypothetical protein